MPRRPGCFPSGPPQPSGVRAPNGPPPPEVRQPDPAAYPAFPAVRGTRPGARLNLLAVGSLRMDVRGPLPLPPPSVVRQHLRPRGHISGGRLEAGTVRPIGATCGRRRVQSAQLPGHHPPLVPGAVGGVARGRSQGRGGERDLGPREGRRVPDPDPHPESAQPAPPPPSPLLMAAPWETATPSFPFLHSPPVMQPRPSASAGRPHAPARRAGGRRRAQGDPRAPDNHPRGLNRAEEPRGTWRTFEDARLPLLL